MMLILKLLASIFLTATRHRLCSVVDLFIQYSGYFRVVDFARLQFVATLRRILVMCAKILETSIFIRKLFTNIMAERTRQKMTLCGSYLTFIHNLRTQVQIRNFVFPDVGNKCYVRVAGFHACVFLNYAACKSIEEGNQ